MLHSKSLLFVHSPAINQIYGGQPTSLLYALSVLSERVSQGKLDRVSEDDIIVFNEQVRTVEEFEGQYRQKFQALLRSKKPRVVGFSNSILSQEYAIRLAELTKRTLPETVTIFGGAHETALKPLYMTRRLEMGADLIVCGDAEYLLAEVVEAVISCEEPSLLQSLARIKGKAAGFAELPGKACLLISEQRECERFFHTSNEPLNLDEVPFMPRYLVKKEQDNYQFKIFSVRGRPLKTAQVMTYRGCLFAINPNNACKFCFIDKFAKRDTQQVIEELESLRQQGYEAIFFDDGTFTSRSTQRKRELADLCTALKQLGFKQWGFQTRVDFLDEEVISTVKAGGCKYIAFGFESTDEKFLGLVGKKTGLEAVRKAFDLCRQYSIEVGVYTIFGAPDEDHRIYESQESIDSTIQFLKEYVENGTIREVLPNLLAYLPGTRLSTDYYTKKKELPHFGVKHSGYPWNRFELGFAHHPEGIEEKRYEIDQRKCSLPEYVIEKASRELGETFLGQNYYMDEQLLSDYRQDKIEAIDFNHAMLSKPLYEAKRAAVNVDNFLSKGTLDHCLINKVSRRARETASRLVNLSSPAQVILGRNTSEALKVASLLIGLRPGDEVLATNVDYEPTLNVFKADRDYSNSDLNTDGYTYGEYSSRKTIKRVGIKERSTGVSVRTVSVLSDHGVCHDQELERRILGALAPSTKVLFLSHVLRTDGRALPLKRIITSVRKVNPEIYVVIDGAQALANVPRVDLSDLQSDIYLATSHKTFESNVLGLAFVSERLIARSQRLLKNRVPLLRGMFDGSLFSGTYNGVMSTAEIVAFVETISWMKAKRLLRGSSFAGLHRHRKGLRNYFLERLTDMVLPGSQDPLVLETFPEPSHPASSFILSFRVPGFDNRLLVQRLWEEHRVFCSYIASAHCIRVSFGMKNSKRDVDELFVALQSSLSNLEETRKAPILDKEVSTSNRLLSVIAA